MIWPFIVAFSIDDVHPTQTSQCYPTVRHQTSSWASDFYHQMRPTVIREPQTHTLHAWNNTDYRSPYQVTDRTPYSNTNQLQQPTLPWCDANRSQAANFNAASNTSYHRALYQQQTSCPYAKAGSQWLTHMPTTCDANEDIISGGIYRWNSPGWNHTISNSLMKSGNVMKQHDFQFDTPPVLTSSGYSTLSNHFWIFLTTHCSCEIVRRQKYCLVNKLLYRTSIFVIHSVIPL